MISPLKTVPVFKQYIWGGSNLKNKYNKPIPDNFAAESWEISCLKDGPCTIDGGEYTGKTLSNIVFSNPEIMLGDQKYTQFPLLVKLLDANNKLSVQVHPDDAYANEHENGGLGKTEMWYVIDAKPGAQLVYGLKDGTTKETYRKAIEDGTLEQLLNYVPVSKGDAFFIPSGTLHAICEGLLIAEIQQSSNTTYRVYDYNRADKEGNKRELHVEKAIAVTNLAPLQGREKIQSKVFRAAGAVCEQLVDCEFFAVEKYTVTDQTTIVVPDNRFELLNFIEGSGTINFSGGSISFAPGDSFFIPAALPEYIIHGACTALRSFVPKKRKQI